jgi:hypothetical protein
VDPEIDQTSGQAISPTVDLGECPDDVVRNDKSGVGSV